MDYNKLIKLCQKYNIEWRNHYGKTKSYIKLKRKIINYENVKKNQKINNYTNLDNDELNLSIKYYYIGF